MVFARRIEADQKERCCGNFQARGKHKKDGVRDGLSKEKLEAINREMAYFI